MMHRVNPPSKTGSLLRLTLILALGGLTACSSAGPDPAAPEASTTPSGPVVQTVNYPLFYFAQRIAGEHAQVEFRAPIDGDPAFWEPGDDDIAAMQKADLILMNGATYAKWASHVSLPPSRLVDTSTAFVNQYIEVEAKGTHRHGAEGEHAHAGTAFTTWLDVRQARQHAEAIRDAMVKAMPDAADDLRANAEALLQDLDELDTDLAKATAAAIGDQPMLASHPVYQYFSRRYGVDIESVLWEPETVPSDEDIAALEAIRADHPAAWMIWEGDPDPASVEKLAAIGVKSVVFDPCGNRPDGGDWLSVMRANIENLNAMSGG